MWKKREKEREQASYPVLTSFLLPKMLALLIMVALAHGTHVACPAEDKPMFKDYQWAGLAKSKWSGDEELG